MNCARAMLLASVGSAGLGLGAVPAWAGDEVLYGAAPGWVVAADLDPATAKEGPAAVLYDWQYRLEDGVEYSYTDMAYRLDNPEALTQGGTLALVWVPDNGDLTVHRLDILRDDEEIDLLGQGVTFDVLRREQNLEQRYIDGELTASLAVPGLREGDVLRVTYSVSNKERAFGNEVQAVQYLPSDPWKVGFSRVIVSWPADEEMHYGAEARVELPEPVERDGYDYLELALPLAERPPMPRDAPSRYNRPDVLRVGSFSDWTEVSRVMAPHFEAAAQFDDSSLLAAQVQAIMDQTDDPLERTVLATRLVQDKVTYLAVGLDGGGYIPQTADETWEKRYGDCKAKSVLLLSLLRRMGIESEVVLVNTQGGDAAPELLPMAAFDHMILHAVVDGTDYWIDGTSTAARMSNIADVPPFYYALPLREGGTGLMAMEQREPTTPQMTIELAVDQSAGTDFPMLFTMDMRLSGPAGAGFRPMVDARDPQLLRQMARSFGNQGGLDGGLVSSIDVSYDEEEATATLHLTGVANSMFEWRDGKMQMDVDAGTDGSGFNPDRARPAWRDIPVATPGPMRQRSITRLVLPDGGKGYSLAGDTDMEGTFGNVRVERHASIEDGVMSAVAESFMHRGEIAPEDLAQAKREARRLENRGVELITPADVTWRWELDEAERQRRAEPIIAAYDAAIDFADENDFGPLQARAMFLESIYDFEGALADYTVLANDATSSWALFRRSSVLEALGRTDEAIEEMQAAYDLDPQNGTAFELARMMAYEGRTEEAGELLSYLPVGEDDELTLADVMATVSALSGDAQEGLSLIAEQVDDKPANAAVLNTDCWYRGLFNVALDDAVDLCTRAVERAEAAAPPLDSRALVRFRLGMLDEAIADLDAALEMVPSLAPSMYLRGVVKLTAGDASGRQDIDTALRMAPQIEQFYARHGIVPPTI